MSAGRNALPADGDPLPDCADAVPGVRHRLSPQHNSMPNDSNRMPAAGNGVSECGHYLPWSVDRMPADHDPMYERGHRVPSGRNPVSRRRDSVSAAGDGMCAAGARSNVHHHHLGILRDSGGHRGRAGLRGD